MGLREAVCSLISSPIVLAHWQFDWYNFLSKFKLYGCFIAFNFGVSVILISLDTCNNLQGLVQMTKRIVSIWNLFINKPTHYGLFKISKENWMYTSSWSIHVCPG